MIREHRGVLLATLLAAVAGAAFDYRLGHPGPGPASAGAEAPTSLPTVELRSLEGAPVRLPDAYPGQPLLLNFWATWCAPCVAEMGELQRFSMQQPANGIQVIGIALDDPAAVSKFLQAHPVSYPILLDPPGPNDGLARLGNPVGMLPYSVLVAADGRILKQRLGAFTPGEIGGWTRDGSAQP